MRMLLFAKEAADDGIRNETGEQLAVDDRGFRLFPAEDRIGHLVGDPEGLEELQEVGDLHLLIVDCQRELFFLARDQHQCQHDQLQVFRHKNNPIYPVKIEKLSLEMRFFNFRFV